VGTSLSRIISRLEKHLEGTQFEHDQSAHGRKGAGKHKDLVKGLAKIFSEPYEGASVFAGKAPPMAGFHVLIAGNKGKIQQHFPNTYSASGLWTDESGKAFVEPSFYAHASLSADPKKVLAAAEKARTENEQQSVGVVYRGKEKLDGFNEAHAYRITSPGHAMVELIDPKPAKVRAAKEMMKKMYGASQVTLTAVQVKWLS
jgi:hypothetical protein